MIWLLAANENGVRPGDRKIVSLSLPQTPSSVLSAWFGIALFLSADLAATAAEPLGPSSRRTGLVISEVMYRPVPRPDGRNLEFIELYNSEAVPTDLSGYRFSGDADFTFPTNTVLPGLSFLVIAPAPSDIQTV